MKIAGKQYKVNLVAKDDAYEAAKTVANVQSLMDENVFGLFNVVGTKNNLAIRDMINEACVPDLLAATGSPASEAGVEELDVITSFDGQAVDARRWKQPDPFTPVLRTGSIEEGGKDDSFSYPSLIQTRDGRLHATYSVHLPAGKSIRHTVIDPAWIRSGR